MKRLVSAICVLGVALVLSSAVSAGTAEKVWTWTSGQNQTVIDWATTILLPQFQATAGQTLTGVKVEMSSDINLEAGLENLTNQASTMSFGLDIATSIKRNGTVLADKHFVTNELNVQVGPRDDNINFTGPGGWHKTYDKATIPVDPYQAPSTEFGAYTGNGNVSFDVSAATVAWLPRGSAGSMAAYYIAQVPTTVKLTYTYDTVPEPASMLAIGTGLISLLGFAKKRKA